MLLSKEDLEYEAEIAGNPARAYEQTLSQELLRNVDKELKSVFQRSSRPRPEKDVLSEELDYEVEAGDPDDPDVFKKTTGKPMPSPTEAMKELEDEMRSAIDRLLPSDSYISAEHRAKIDASKERLKNYWSADKNYGKKIRDEK